MKTKSIAIVLITLAFGILSLPLTATAVVDWTKYGSNPVLVPGDPGAWDDEDIERPCVIKDGSTYKMWYGGFDGTEWQIGYATSGDGITWSKYDSGVTPILSPSSSGWDSAHVGLAWIIKMESGDTPYKMWYTGTDTESGETNVQIGYATSTNGTDWVKGDSGVTDPVLQVGSGVSDWDGEGVASPTVIKDGSTYKMWYVGWNDTAQTVGIGYATSSDGITWTKYNDSSTPDPPYAASDPVINLGPSGSWDGDFIWSPTVIKEESIYRMWYDGEEFDTPVGGETIGYAYSMDGIHWTKYAGNPVITEGQSGSFDEDGALDLMVLKDGNTYKMWYSGDEYGGTTQIGYATSQAWQGSQPAINQMGVATLNRPSEMNIMLYLIPEGPGPLDINELKVDGPGGSGFSYTFSDADITNWMGTQFPVGVIPMDPVPGGTYTFSMKANNSQTASNTRNLTVSTISVPLDGVSYLDRSVNDGTWNTGDQVYTGNPTPYFRWKPYLGSTYYYRVRIIDWKYRAWWYASDPDIGTNVDGNGYMYAQVPDDMLKSNTPYHWLVEVMDTNDVWSAHNRAWSDWRHFYTGTKSGTGDFLDDNWGEAWFRSTRSFRDGDQAHFGAFVHKLAPWDIELDSPNQFRVDLNGVTPIYDFNPDNNAFTPDPFPFMYLGATQGFPVGGTYNFYVCEDGPGSCDSASKSFTVDNSVPQVTKEEMHHENVVTRIDNAYLPYTDPALYWKSKGSGYHHRVMIFDWNYRRLVWASDYLTGVGAGGDMSAQVPEGALKEHGLYRWWVEVYDNAKQNRTRSQWLSFVTGESEADKGFLPAIYLLLLLDD